MKYKSLFAALFLGLALVACKQEPVGTLAEIQVSESYVSLNVDGGSSTITINTSKEWSVDAASVPEWLTIEPMSGYLGPYTLTFSAGATTSTNKAEVKIICGDKTQYINVIQYAQAAEVVPMTVAEAIALIKTIDKGDGQSYNLDGEYCVKGIVCKIDEISTSYGNATYYLSDDGKFVDGQWLEVYRGFWLNGAKFTKGDEFAVGDALTIMGQLMSYKGIPETVQNTAYVTKYEKSLIGVDDFPFEKLPAKDTTFHMVVKAAESPLLVNSDSEWLQITGVTSDGKYVLHADENTRTAERTATVSIQGPTALKSVSITQKGIEATGSTVSEIIAMDDNSMVQTLPSTVVVALTTKGAVVSDGEKAIYVYGDKAAALKVGDGVQIDAKKTTYNGVPELTDITAVAVDSEGNPVSYPEAVDVTAQAVEYTASEAEYIKLSGTLAVSGNYYNLTLDGVDPATKQGSLVYPVDELDAKSYNGQKITVTGFFNGLSSGGKYLNVIVTKISEFVDNPKGTLTNPYEASELAALMKSGTIPEGEIYARGTINTIDNVNLQYGNAQYWLSDDGSSADLEVYRGFWYNGDKFTSEDQIKVGDVVVVYGKVKMYNETPEFDANNRIVTLNGKALPSGDGTAENPFNVTKLADMLLAGETIEGEVYAKGIICKIDNVNLQYGNAQYWLSDDGYTLYMMEVFRGFWFGGDKFTSEDQIAVKDEVVVYGKVKLYVKDENKTPEFDANNRIISLNGKTE